MPSRRERSWAGLRRTGPVSGKLAIFLIVALGWSTLVGLGLFLAGVELSSGVGIAVMAVLYMPAPMVAALIAEGGLVRSRFRLPRRAWRSVLAYLGIPVVVVVGFALVFLAAVFVCGDLLGLSYFGELASTSAEIARGAEALLGQAAVEAAGPPPPFPVLLVAGIWGAVVAGWTVNGLFAMGEEYGWRGLMWDELEHHGTVKANLIIGTVWGLWHAPVILQGYNYPGQPLVGTLAMVAFCIGMSFALTAIRRRTGSLIPVAAAHGAFNALAPILLILAPGTSRVLTGPLGATAAVILTVIGGLLWFIRRPLPTAPTCSVTTAADIS
ncbi:MAG TPA: CPBP family intramembrane glutamic endopeptidase [Propionibacteriaceae bacterium]